MPNEAQRRRWNDEQTVATWHRRERFTDSVVPHVLAALDPSPGESVLDIGSGLGNLSIAIAPRVGPGGSVTGADISHGMVDMARGRARAAAVPNVTFGVYDMQTETPPGAPFDAATSQFGVMFFEDPVAAFTNIRKALKRGGRLAFACWQSGAKNNWCTAPVLARFAPPAPPPPPGIAPTGPFALGDPRYARNILTSAGFIDVVRTPKRLIVRAPADSVGDESTIDAMALPPQQREAALEAFRAHMAKFVRNGDLCRFELHVQIFTARRG